jgi:hypothetical protein
LILLFPEAHWCFPACGEAVIHYEMTESAHEITQLLQPFNHNSNSLSCFQKTLLTLAGLLSNLRWVAFQWIFQKLQYLSIENDCDWLNSGRFPSIERLNRTEFREVIPGTHMSLLSVSYSILASSANQLHPISSHLMILPMSIRLEYRSHRSPSSMDNEQQQHCALWNQTESMN